MSLLHLPQTIELERGEALQLFLATDQVWQQATQATRSESPVPLDLGLLLAEPYLVRLGKRLFRLYQAEKYQVGKPAKKPRSFRMSAEEVAVVTRYVLPATRTLPVLGKVQQKSLNLEPYIKVVG